MQIIDVITEYIHNAYEYQVDKLSYIGYRCICIDLRGYGKSDRPAY